jgi:hypothetical protein
MPVERQWERANTPLNARDKRLLLVVAVLAAVAIAASVAVYLTRSTSTPAAGCLVADVPSTMGGARLKVCGDAAHDFCRSHADDARLAAACRRQGFAADLGP